MKSVLNPEPKQTFCHRNRLPNLTNSHPTSARLMDQQQTAASSEREGEFCAVAFPLFSTATSSSSSFVAFKCRRERRCFFPRLFGWWGLLHISTSAEVLQRIRVPRIQGIYLIAKLYSVGQDGKGNNTEQKGMEYVWIPCIRSLHNYLESGKDPIQ